MKIYGWVRHLYRDEGISREERMRLKRRERFRAANDVASLEGHVDDGFFSDHEIACHLCTWGCWYDIGSDLFDPQPLSPLTAPLVALALKAA